MRSVLNNLLNEIEGNNCDFLSRNFCDYSSRKAEAQATPLMTGGYQEKYFLAWDTV